MEKKHVHWLDTFCCVKGMSGQKVYKIISFTGKSVVLRHSEFYSYN